MTPRPAVPSHEIAPWSSRTDAALAPRRRSFGSPALWGIAALAATALVLAPFAAVDRVVSSTAGRIVATRPLTTFQALDPSIIRTVEVRDGQEVRAGQVLATLDATFAVADVAQLRRQSDGLDADIARARAEQEGAAYRPAAAGLPDAAAGSYARLQARLFADRAAQLRAQTTSFDEKIAAARASVARIEADRLHLVEREKIAHQIETMRDTLYRSGSSSLLNLLGANDARLEMLRSLDSDANSLVELRHQISALESDRQGTLQAWSAAGSQELASAQNQRETVRAALDKALKHQDLVRLVAPEAAVVLTLTKLSAGSVLREGEPVLTLMPLAVPVEAEIRFSAADIGFVRPGDRVTLKVDAFSAFEHGTAQGHLAWISEGAFTSDDAGKPVDPYYRARVAIDRTAFIDVPATFRLIPGMTLGADIDVGRRSLPGFLTGALFHGLGEALREP